MIFWLLLLLLPSLAIADSELTVGGRTGADHIIQDEGTSLRPRPYLNFTGSGVTCSDVNGKTKCDVSGGGGSGSGNVGIGTTGWAAYYGADGSTVNAFSGMRFVSSNVGIGTALPEALLTVGNKAFNVNANGNVGVGTFNPSELFAVGSASNFRMDSSGNITRIGGTAVTVNGTQVSLSNAGTVTFQNSSTNSAAGSAVVGGGNAVSPLNLKSTSGTGTTDFIRFTVGTNGGTEAMRIQDNSGTANIGIGTTFPGGALTVMSGNVGIGTWIPAQALSVNGVITANGTSLNSAAATLTTNLGIADNNGITYTRAMGTDSSTRTYHTFAGTHGGTTGSSNVVAITGSSSKTGGGTVTGLSSIPTMANTSGTMDFVIGVYGRSIRNGVGGGTLNSFGVYGDTGTVTNGTVTRNYALGAAGWTGIKGNIGIGTVWDSSLYLATAPPNGGMIVEGNVGIGTITPGAILDIGGNLRLATGGFLVSQQTTAPTVASNDCGTTAQGTVAAGSSDLLGTVTAGTLNVTSCAMTFNKTHNTAPLCLCEDNTNILGVKCTTTTTKLTITSTTSMSGDVITYFCPTNAP